MSICLQVKVMYFSILTGGRGVGDAGFERAELSAWSGLHAYRLELAAGFRLVLYLQGSYGLRVLLSEGDLCGSALPLHAEDL